MILLFLRSEKRKIPLATSVISYIVLTFYWGGDVGRLFGVCYGVIVLSITLSIIRFTELKQVRPYMRSLLHWVVVSSLLVTFFSQHYLYLSQSGVDWLGGVYLSEKGRDEWFISRRIFNSDYLEMRNWVKKNAPGDEELYGYKLPYLFHFQKKHFSSKLYFGEQMDNWFLKGMDFTKKQLDSYSVKWILMKNKYNKDSPDNYAMCNFIERYLNLAHNSGEYSLYKLLEFDSFLKTEN